MLSIHNRAPKTLSIKRAPAALVAPATGNAAALAGLAAARVAAAGNKRIYKCYK